MTNDQIACRAKLTGLAQHNRINPFHSDQQREFAKAGFALALWTS